MQIASSANRTCKELRSASLDIATARTPSSLHAQITRRAISPRLAIKIFLNMKRSSYAFSSQPLAQARRSQGNVRLEAMQANKQEKRRDLARHPQSPASLPSLP